jgi:hypothetical protein
MILTARRFAEKVAWEGGIVGALDYGLRSEDTDDPELSAAWAALEEPFDALVKGMSRVDLLLRRARGPSTSIVEEPSPEMEADHG